jgi:hypothetical protein
MGDCNSLVDQEMHRLTQLGINGPQLQKSINDFFKQHCNHSHPHQHSHSHKDDKNNHLNETVIKTSDVDKTNKKPLSSVAYLCLIILFLLIPFCIGGIFYGKSLLKDYSRSQKKIEQGNALIAIGSIGIILSSLIIIYLIIYRKHKYIAIGFFIVIFACLFFTFISTTVTQ